MPRCEGSRAVMGWRCREPSFSCGSPTSSFLSPPQCIADCSTACIGCMGAGPARCKKCNKGYQRDGAKCLGECCWHGCRGVTMPGVSTPLPVCSLQTWMNAAAARSPSARGCTRCVRTRRAAIAASAPRATCAGMGNAWRTNPPVWHGFGEGARRDAALTHHCHLCRRPREGIL